MPTTEIFQTEGATVLLYAASLCYACKDSVKLILANESEHCIFSSCLTANYQPPTSHHMIQEVWHIVKDFR